MRMYVYAGPVPDQFMPRTQLWTDHPRVKDGSRWEMGYEGGSDDAAAAT